MLKIFNFIMLHKKWSLLCLIFILLSLTSSFYIKLLDLQILTRQVSLLQMQYDQISQQRKMKIATLGSFLPKEVALAKDKLTNLTLKEEEITTLKQYLRISDDQGLKEREKFLLQQNKMVFKELPLREKDIIKECEVKLASPVEITEKDLNKILAILEGKNSPFVVKTIKISYSQDKLMLMDLIFIKREFLHE